MAQKIAINRKAQFDYFILEKFEAGLSLLGSEVKSLREGKVSLRESFVRLLNGEAYLFNCHIPHYSKMQGYVDLDPTRSRKLLLNRKEINHLVGETSRKGLTIIPLSIYFKKGYAKVEVAIAQGKKHYDKRESLKRKIHERETAQAMKRFIRKGG